MPNLKTITVKVPCGNCFGHLYYTDNSGPESIRYDCGYCKKKGWEYKQIEVLDEQTIPGE